MGEEVRTALIYPVKQGGFVDKWLISGVLSTPVSMTPACDVFQDYHPGASVKDKNGKERKSEAKQEYLRIGDFKKQEYPAGVAMDKLYYPADTNRVDCSGVFKFPADVRLFARAYFVSSVDQKIKVAIFCCGGMKVWVNGNPAAEYYPYEANIECSKDIELSLISGENEIVVALNDYGERNINFKFGFKITSVDREIKVKLPVSTDVEKIERMRKNLNSLYPDRLNYRDGTAYLCTEEGFVEDCEFTIESEDMPRFVVNACKGEKKLRLFDVSEAVSGYHEFTLSTVVQGVELKTSFCAQICPGERERQSIFVGAAEADNPEECENGDSCSNIEARKRFCIRYAAECSDSLDSYIATLGCAGKAGAGGQDIAAKEEAAADIDSIYARFEADILKSLDFAERRGDCADFKIQRFIWLMEKFGDQIPEKLRDRIRTLLLGFRYWYDEPGNDAMWFYSENHALAFHSGEYLAGQLYPDEIFTNSGLNGKEHMAKAKSLIIEWFEKLLKYGYNEWNSATYISVDVFTYITLYSFAGDEEIRELAKKALDYTFEMYAYNSFKGVMGTSNGRTYDKDILGNECMAGNSQIWLAWGIGCINRKISPAMYISMSDYVPPEKYRKIALGEPGTTTRLVVEKKEGTMAVPTTLCKTKNYILGTCISPRTGGPGSQELLISLFLKDATTRIWMNMPGEGKVFGIRRPGYFSGNALTPLVTQKENVAAVSYYFPKAFINRCEVKYIHIMCDEQECDEVLLGDNDNKLFIRRGNAFAVFICMDGIIRRTDRAALSGKEFIFDGVNSDWLIKVSDTDELESFEKFVEYHGGQKTGEVGSQRKSAGNFVRRKGRKLYYDDKTLGRLKFELLTKDYMLRKVGIKKLIKLGVSKDMVKQFLRELVKARG